MELCLVNNTDNLGFILLEETHVTLRFSDRVPMFIATQHYIGYLCW